jgi:hypothetical protein
LHKLIYQKEKKRTLRFPKELYTSNPDKVVVVKLCKSLYGLAQAPRVFYRHLVKNLQTRGFEACTDVDPCLWIHKKKGIICLVYVDDCLFFGKDKTKINQIVKDLEHNMRLLQEDSVTAFLGIDIKTEGGTHTLTQPQLIEQVIQAMEFEYRNTVDTPATTDPLGMGPEGEPFHEDWG